MAIGVEPFDILIRLGKHLAEIGDILHILAHAGRGDRGAAELDPAQGAGLVMQLIGPGRVRVTGEGDEPRAGRGG